MTSPPAYTKVSKPYYGTISDATARTQPIGRTRPEQQNATSTANFAWLYLITFLVCAIDSSIMISIGQQPPEPGKASLWPGFYTCDWVINMLAFVFCLHTIGVSRGLGCGALWAKMFVALAHLVVAFYFYLGSLDTDQERPSILMFGKALSSWMDVGMALAMVWQDCGFSCEDEQFEASASPI